MPQSFDYLLLGGGTSCGYAAAAIREIDKSAPIGIISADTEPPYDRPPLSKNYLTKDGMEIADAHSKDHKFYPDNDIDLMLGTEAYSVKTGPRAVELRNGDLIHYGKLLYALGSEPQRPPISGAERVELLRTAADSRRIKEEAKSGKSAVVIGGGWIGVEVAASLLSRGMNVSLIEFADRVLPKLGSPACADAIRRELEKMGAKVNLGQAVAEVSDGAVRTKSGERLEGELIVAGVGAKPRIKMGQDAGLNTGEQGLLADANLRSSDSNIWLAGDVAEYADEIMGRPFRAEHHMHAKWTGEHAGRGMAGQSEAYRKAPYFFSDIGELSLIFRGDPDAKGRTFQFGDPEAPLLSEIVLRDDGRIASFTDLRKDYKAQEPLSDMIEKLIVQGASVEPLVAALAKSDFDLMRLQQAL
ncbi:MAG: FAD-dependent oxidoreductase [Armatimonadetes bacterium]|nr:FAD-dependent oxidoreductase [Armatimonadota bacterium]